MFSGNNFMRKLTKLVQKIKVKIINIKKVLLTNFILIYFFVKDIHLGLFSSQLKSNSIKCA